MSPSSARAFSRRASAGLVLLVAAWSGSARAAEDDVSLDLGAVTLELRRVPKGTFTQGSPPNEPGREADESPRNVTMSRAFWIGKVPVTRAQFSRFVTETRFVTDAEKGQIGGFGWDGRALVQKKEFTWRSPGFPQKDEDPVVLVTFGDANAFVAWATRKTGRRVRLPTEAEWEYAARAGTTTPWAGASKEDEALTVGWFKQNATSTTHPVARKGPNAFGLFDMAGNVFEWCRDVHAPYPPGDAIDPETTTNTAAEPEKRVLRGGSWLRDPRRGRSAARHRAAPGSRSAETGFRVAMDDDSPIAPAPGAVPANDFAPASPIGMSSAAPLEDASAPSEQAPAGATPARPPGEGGGWSLVIAPVAAAGFAVAWVLARRRRGDRTGAPVVMPRAAAEPVVRHSVEPRAPAPPSPSLSGPVAARSPFPSSITGPVAPASPPPTQHESVRGVAIAVIAPDERPSSPPPSMSAVPTGSPLTSEPSIIAAPATFSEALLVRASVVEAGLFEGSIVDVPLTPIADPSGAPKPDDAAAQAVKTAEDEAAEPSKDSSSKDAPPKLELIPSDDAVPAASSSSEAASEAGAGPKRDDGG